MKIKYYSMEALFSRKVTRKERDFLNRLMENRKLGYRAKIILLSWQGYSVNEIERMVNLHAVNVRKWIRRFNKEGVKALVKEEKSHPKFSERARNRMAELALKRPSELGLPFNNWSLTKLRDYLVKKRVVSSISIEQIRRVLRSKGIKLRVNRRKLISRDPEYRAKKAIISQLYDKPNSRILCFDVKGKITLKRYAGREWRKRSKVIPLNQRIRGYFHLFSCYDVHDKKIYHRYFMRYTSKEFVKFIRWIKRTFKEKVYLILDNGTQHTSKYTKERLLKIGGFELVFLPKNAPHLNKMDRKFEDLQRDVIDNSNYSSVLRMKRAITKWIKSFNRSEITAVENMK